MRLQVKTNVHPHAQITDGLKTVWQSICYYQKSKPICGAGQKLSEQNMIWEQPSFSACLVKKLSLAGQVLKKMFCFF